MVDTFNISEEYRSHLKRAWSQLDLVLSGMEANEDTIEVMIQGVPNYPWYMNCGVICMTMILGFWDDHEYDGFIPGGNSATGYYWAVAEELRWNSFNESIFGTRIEYYAQAAEYGNHFDFVYSGHLGKKWEDYTSNIDTYQAPLFVIWQGPPYGQHATVGVGYKEEGAQRFMILHDTGIDYPTYINYDEYNETETNTFCWHLPSSLSASKFPVINKRNCFSKEDDVLYMDSINLEFIPDLVPDDKSYHCMESADIDIDGYKDLIICNFRNYASQKLDLYLYKNGQYVKNNEFAPVFKGIEHIHVIKAADMDTDGDQDIAVAGYWSKVRIFENESGRLNNTPIIVDSGTVGRYFFTDLIWTDIDIDGDPDLIVSTQPGEIRVYRNNEGAFEQIQEVGSGMMYMKVRAADFNNDGYPEILTSDRNGSVRIFLNQGGLLAESPYFAPSSGHGAMSFDVDDVDGDGFLEIVTVDDGQLVLFNNEEGALSETPHYINNTIDCYAKDIVLNDLDEDAFPELIVTNYNTQNCIFKNVNGTLQSTPYWISEEAIPTMRVHVHDLWDDDTKQIFFLKPRGALPEFFQVGSRPVLSVNPDTLDFDTSSNELRFYIENTGGGTLSWSVSENPDKSWIISIDPHSSTGDDSVSVTVTVDRSQLSSSNDTGLLKITSNAGDKVITVLIKEKTVDLLVECKVDLAQGWNMFSINIDPVYPNVDSVMSDIKEKIVLIKDCEGNTYVPDYGINNIGTLDYRLGYKGYLREAAELNVSGQSVVPCTSINLKSGWNMISYLPTTSVDIAEALASISDELVIAKNGSGKTYVPAYSINTIGDMEPGEGYKVYLSTAATLVYPDGSSPTIIQDYADKNSSSSDDLKDAQYFKFNSNTGQNCTVVVPSSIDPRYWDGTLLTSGDEIGVFNSAGLCCGAVVWNGENTAITVWGDDVQTADIVDGFLENDTLRFRVWDSKKDLEYAALAGFENESNFVYHIDRFGVLTELENETETEIIHSETLTVPEAFRLKQNHPNPFNPETSIEFYLPEQAEVRLTVYDMTGREVSCLVQKTLSAGIYTAKWKGRDQNGHPMASGMYFYRLVANPVIGSGENMVQVKKMIFMK